MKGPKIIWEYKTEAIPQSTLSHTLNSLGLKRWELVMLIPRSQLRMHDDYSDFTAVFKRQKIVHNEEERE